MPENGQRAPPMMGRTARLHHDGGCFLLLEKCDQVFPLDFAADHDVSGLINSVNLEHRFGGVEANHGNGHRGRSLSGCFTTTGSWHIDAWGRPPCTLWRRLVAASIRWPGGPVRWELPPSTSCFEHRDGTCAPAGWPRRMSSRKSRL